MRNQEPDKIKVSTSKESSRLNLYGGCFDLVNGTSLSEKISNQLKFAALFYERIIVPDGFFHCYGPLSNYFTGYIKNRSNLEELEVVKLLKAGIIIPALRKGESLYENWKAGDNIGITPGKYLILNRDDGNKILGYIDDMTTCYMNWPDDMAEANKIEFSTLLYDLLVDESSFYSLLNQLNQSTPPDLSPGFHLEWIHCQSMLEDICNSIVDNKRNPKFRRGDIENLIRKHLGIEMKSYDELKSRALKATTDKNFSFAIGYYLLNLTSTIYEAYHANQFHTVGGLFPQHEDALIDRGLYDYLVDLKEVNTDYKEKRVLFGSLDVSRLSVDQIIEFRKEERELFMEYCEKVSKIEFLEVEQFQDTNSEFIDFLVNQYVPVIIQRYPQCGYIEKFAKGIEAIVTLIFSNNSATIHAAGLPLVVYVGGIHLAERLITGKFKITVENIDRFIQNKLLMSRFKKNNYTTWNVSRK